MKDELMVIVLMITYKHENFIPQAIESVLMQETNFKFELIIADDCSPDKTKEIVRKIIATNPKGSLIKYFRHEQNIGISSNGMFALNQCNSKYIAMCEGDDYWIDPLKLQKQVDFLEKNNDFSICFTDYIVYNESNKEYSYPGLIQRFKKKTVFTSRNIILNNILPTATAMFRVRKEVFSKYDLNLYPGDWFLHILNSEYGKIKFLPFESAVYRKHDGGVCSATSPIINNQKYIKSIKIFRKVYSKNYKVQFLLNIVVIKIRLQNIKFKLLGK
jgi:glycosyltransferase involved in cell wall biosynthesis